MDNILGKKYNFKKLISYAFPSIMMMLCMSAYTMVDGIMVSRFVDTDALAALNILFPVMSFIIAVSIMFASGGSAVIAKYMGEGKDKEGKQIFSMLFVIFIAIGVMLGAIGLIFTKDIVRLLGADDRLLNFCMSYAKILLWFTPLSMLQMLFGTMFTVAGKPVYSFILTFIAGVTNIVLDYVLISPVGMGVAGAALATGISYTVPSLFGIFYFSFYRKGTLYIVKPKAKLKEILQIMGNGSSEMVSNISVAIVTLMFNLMMMKYLGADGVSAITIVLYIQFFLNSVFMGYSSGIAPIVSYKYGAKDHGQQKTIFRMSMIFICSVALTVFALSEIVSPYFVLIFAPKSSPVFEIASRGSRIFAVSFLFSGINIFASAYFTSLSNGAVSSAIAFCRSLLFTVVCFFILPPLIGVTGIWLAVPIAEILGLAVSVFFLLRYRKRYGFFLEKPKLADIAEYSRE